jgi:cytochrome P450
MSPTFSSGKMRRMQPLIDECVQTMVENLKKLCKSGEAEMDVKEVFGALSMDVVITVAFGTKVNSLMDVNNPIIEHAKKLSNKTVDTKTTLRGLVYLACQPLFVLLKIPLIDPQFVNFFKSLVLKIVGERKKNVGKEKRYDFLQLMLDAMENGSAELESDINKVADITSHLPEGEEYKNIVTHNKSIQLCY